MTSSLRQPAPTRCPRTNCGDLLDITTDGNGHVLVTCAGCLRNRRKLCRDCPRSLAKCNALRCPTCAKGRLHAAQLERDRARYPRKRKADLARHRSALPHVRERRRQYMANYRATHPRDDIDRLYQRLWMTTRRASPAFRAKENKRKRELRARSRGGAT